MLCVQHLGLTASERLSLYAVCTAFGSDSKWEAVSVCCVYSIWVWQQVRGCLCARRESLLTKHIPLNVGAPGGGGGGGDGGTIVTAFAPPYSLFRLSRASLEFSGLNDGLCSEQVLRESQTSVFPEQNCVTQVPYQPWAKGGGEWTRTRTRTRKLYFPRIVV